MLTVDDVLDDLDKSIEECATEKAYWEKRLSLAEEKVAAIKQAIRLCDSTIATYREIKGTVLIGRAN